MLKGKFIVIDGPDFSGKTTVAARAQERFGENLLVTREPGGAKGLAPISNEFRELSLNSKYAESASGIEIYNFMWASRIAHKRELLKPALMGGKNALCDRFASSTWAFNIVAQKSPELKERFWLMYDAVLSDIEPDLYIHFDVTLEEVMRRKKKKRTDIENHFDKKGLEFQIAMREGFEEFYKELEKKKGRVCHQVVDANLPEEELWQSVLLILEEQFSKK